MYDPSRPISKQVEEMDLNRKAPSSSSLDETAEKQGDEDTKKVPRRFPEEENEDILRETNDRFVLFPIKYREVRSSTSFRTQVGTELTNRFGQRTKHARPRSGQQKRLISATTSMTGIHD
jgi:hypothetical protein